MGPCLRGHCPDNDYSLWPLNVSFADVNLTSPTNIVASGGSVAGSIKATFTASSNAAVGQTYTAKVYSDAGLTTQVGSDISNYVSGTDITGLTGGTTYYVTITADAVIRQIRADCSSVLTA